MVTNFALVFLLYPYFQKLLRMCIFYQHKLDALSSFTSFMIAGRNLFNHLKSALSTLRSFLFRVQRILFKECLVISILNLMRFAIWCLIICSSTKCDQYNKFSFLFFYWRLQVTILLSELSLDVVLFVIGKLDLAGPYAVKSSLVLANCCKVL